MRAAGPTERALNGVTVFPWPLAIAAAIRVAIAARLLWALGTRGLPTPALVEARRRLRKAMIFVIVPAAWIAFVLVAL